MHVIKASTHVEHFYILIKLLTQWIMIFGINLHTGIRGQSNNWFHWYLTHRIQFTWKNRSNSQPYLISHGVPQRSVLGPLLFIIFMNDLQKSIRYSQMLHFADDTNILYINKPTKKLRSLIMIFLLLFNAWDLLRSVSMHIRLNW